MYGEPKCGEIWMCDIGDQGNGVQRGYRPVMVLSNNLNNAHAPTLNVIPLTTKMNKRNLPIHVEIWNYKECGLRAPSTLMIEQITTIPAESLDKYVGMLSDRDILDAIRKAMEVQFPILSMCC